jgi:cystathionine beta-lyase
MDFEVAPEIRKTLSNLVANSDLGYLGPFPELAPAFQHYAKQTWGWEFDPSRMRFATDVGVAATEIMRVLTKPGDRVLLNSPVYTNFSFWVREVGAIPHDVPLIRDENTWRLDIAGIEKAMASGVKVYMLCSPQNPVGRIHTREELQAISDLANKYGAVVIADEIHAPLSYEQFTPYLSIPGSEKNGILITSNSKSWNTAGLKAALFLTLSDEVNQKLSGLPEAMHWRSSLLGAFAMATAYRECGYWMDDTKKRLQENLATLREELEKQLPKAVINDVQATYLAWIDLSVYEVDRPAQKILKDGKVAVVAGEEHAPELRYTGFVRFNFGSSKARIIEAVRRMKLGLES